MLRTGIKLFITLLIAFGLFAPTFVSKAEAKGKRHKKAGFFTRMKREIKHNFKMGAKKTRRAIYKTGANVSDKIMDGATKAKSSISGKRPKHVWRKGHYKKGNKNHTKGHWVRNKKRSHHSSSTSPIPPSAPAPSPIPSAPSPDPVLPQ